jgi:uncharacterized protein YdaU (DUF1376 family)
MSIVKGPYYPLYTADFLEGTLLFDAEETGAYINLLIYQWNNGFVPNDKKSIKKIAKISEKKLEKVLKKFTLTPDSFLQNERVEKERSKFAKLSVKQSDNAKKRWQKNEQKTDAMALPDSMPNECQTDASKLNYTNTISNDIVNKEGVTPPVPLPEKKELSYDFIKNEPEEFKEAFRKWISYKKSRKQMYKTQETLQDAYQLLKTYSNKQPELAMQVVLGSTGNNYAGLQPLKNHATNKNNNRPAIETGAGRKEFDY